MDTDEHGWERGSRNAATMLRRGIGVAGFEVRAAVALLGECTPAVISASTGGSLP
jgi:hypothetical protein